GCRPHTRWARRAHDLRTARWPVSSTRAKVARRMSSSLRDVLASHRVVVCVGSGGVGKTTTAASLALHAAMHGRRVLCLTIDPAKRLANSLGLTTMTTEEQDVPR